ncbi:thiamine pyrophosphate-binding protein [Hoylesella pleuritidis]|uniref:thiamine pyrophosphate-binding protein n=1 Tax=Hoylesella pleuritidis TaxID=407975 RepID=UPI0028D9076D|nr:thiamine pyrophosphate-binding protein [Hoylesella pleuritidis]
MRILYTDNKNQQILIALLKAYNIHKVIASPGGTNPALLMSLQMDGSFEMYSCVDERSAAYMACGLAEESGEPVIICCTGATASRNYMSALTEAFYRKIPIIVITCSRPNYVRGHLMPQVTNRSVYPADILVEGENLQVIKKKDDIWDCEFKINKALLALRHRGGGPIHFNVETITQSCTTEDLPTVHVIDRITQNDHFPELVGDRIGIFMGSHKCMSSELTAMIDHFCEQHNAVVFCDHTSGYYGKYYIPFSLIGTQHNHKFGLEDLDILIHLGEVSGDYLTMESLRARHIWRVSEDGEIRIRFNSLDYIFEMPDKVFFSHYLTDRNRTNITFWKQCNEIYQSLYDSIDDLPLSLIYLAYKLAPQIPHNSVVHFAIINALRAWNFFKIDNSIRTNCNVGGFGIDGCTSSLIGASLVNREKLYYLFTGDLAFFYDLNSLGNRHLGPNVRILLLNDGKGAEFTHFMWKEYQGDRNLYIAGAGHFGNQSKTLVKDFSEDLGFEYLQADSKEEFLSNYQKFIDPKVGEKPILFEIITSTEGQSEAWKKLCNLAEATVKERINKIISKYENKALDSVKKVILKKMY